MAKEKAPAFQFYPKDFLSDPNTAVMTSRQIGAYLLLLSYVWLQGRVVDDGSYLASLARLSDDEWAHDEAAIRRCFVSTYEDGQPVLRHQRLDEERVKQAAWREKSSKGGKKQGKPARRRTKRAPNTKDAVTTVEAPLNHPSTLQSSSSSSSVPPNPQRGEGASGDDDDAAAWLLNAYPRWYAEERSGAAYRSRPTLDWQAALGLTETWPDRAHLERMCRTFLRATNLPAAHANRSLEVFARAYASGCDAAVRQGAGA